MSAAVRDSQVSQAARTVGAAHSRSAEVLFDIAAPGGQNQHLMNPAELLLSGFAACVLKNVERYAEIIVRGVRQDEHTDGRRCPGALAFLKQHVKGKARGLLEGG